MGQFGIIDNLHRACKAGQTAVKGVQHHLVGIAVNTGGTADQRFDLAALPTELSQTGVNIFIDAVLPFLFGKIVMVDRLTHIVAQLMAVCILCLYAIVGATAVNTKHIIHKGSPFAVLLAADAGHTVNSFNSVFSNTKLAAPINVGCSAWGEVSRIERSLLISMWLTSSSSWMRRSSPNAWGIRPEST